MIKQIVQKIIALFNKLAHITGLIRLKVFYQLLVIIAVMVAFLFIQSYSSFQMINTMQKTTKTILVDDSFKSSQISKFKEDLIKLQAAYLDAIVRNETSSSSLENEGERLITFDWLDDATENEVNDKLNSVKELLKSPPSKVTYDTIYGKLFELTIIMNNLDSKLSSTTSQNITNNDRFLNESRLTGIIILILSTIFFLLIGSVIVSSISAPLRQMESAAKGLAVGDLTHNITASGSPEITRVVNGLNQAITGLRELVKNIHAQSLILINASQELRTASSETGKSASEVARTMEELANGTTRQAEQVSQAAATVQSFSEMVQKVTSDTETIANASEKVADAAKIGLKATVDVTNEIQELYNSTHDIDSVINELSKITDQINEITSVIGGIAEQTSLLALNASIEAARAGEYGKGFAVVAHETGKLAEQSKQAAQLIGDLIENIKGRTDQAVETMQKGMERAENGKNLTAQTSTTFENIFKSLNDNLNQIEEVAQSAKKMAESNKVVIEVINEIAAISQESLASTEEVSATTEQQSASTEQVAALANSLSQIANNLNQSVAVFAIEEKTSETEI